MYVQKLKDMHGKHCRRNADIGHIVPETEAPPFSVS
jgi:hypothetical protein